MERKTISLRLRIKTAVGSVLSVSILSVSRIQQQTSRSVNRFALPHNLVASIFGTFININIVAIDRLRYLNRGFRGRSPHSESAENVGPIRF